MTNSDSIKALVIELLIDLDKLTLAEVPESLLRITDLIDDGHKALLSKEVIVP